MSLKAKSTVLGKLLIALDLTYMDDLLIQYAAFLKKQLKLEHVVLYHNIKLNEPDKISGILENLDRPLEDILRKEIEQSVGDKLGDDYSIHIGQSDDTMDDMIAFMQRAKLQTVLFGKKLNYEGSGYLIERFISESPDINIIAYPETAHFNHSNVLLPTDFSRKSAVTIKNALEINKELESSLLFMHVYTIPNIYFPYIPVKDMKKDIQKDADREWEKFKRRYFQGMDLGEVAFSFDAEKSFAEIIYKFAVKNQINLIILPNKQSFMNNLIVQVLRRDMHIPLFFLDS